MVGLKVAPMVGSAGVTKVVNMAVPTKRVLAPLPFLMDTVEVLVVATPWVTLADAGLGVTDVKVRLAADTMFGMANVMAEARQVVSVRVRYFILLGWGLVNGEGGSTKPAESRSKKGKNSGFIQNDSFGFIN